MSELFPTVSARKEVRQHNVLTSAHFRYSKLQMDLLIFLLSKLRNTSDDLVYLLPVKELEALTGHQQNYDYLKAATANMGSRVFHIKLDKREEQLWMFQRVAYLEGEGVIEMTLSSTILPYLFDLRNNFTSYEIAAFLKLDSVYAKRIYPLCSQWKDKGATPIYSLLELKKILDLIDDKDGSEKYPVYSDFNARVLSSSIKAINAVSDLEVSLVTKKKGKAIVAVGFTVKQKPRILAIDFPASTSSNIPEGITQAQYDTAYRALEIYQIKDEKHRRAIFANPELIKQVNKFAFDHKNGKIVVTTNPGGLLLVTLGLVDAKRKLARKGN